MNVEIATAGQLSAKDSPELRAIISMESDTSGEPSFSVHPSAVSGESLCCMRSYESLISLPLLSCTTHKPSFASSGYIIASILYLAPSNIWLVIIKNESENEGILLDFDFIGFKVTLWRSLNAHLFLKQIVLNIIPR